MLEFDNDTALITGAGRGIGKAIIIELGKLGVNVIGTATTQDGVNAIRSFLAENKIHGDAVLFDAKNLDTYKNVYDISKGVSILVNNAGIIRDNLILKMTDEEWDDVLNVNLTSVFKLTKYVSKKMMSKKYGRIINISSISAFKPEVGHSNYMAAKSALINFTKGVAIELSRYNITANCVAPGLINTDMTKNLIHKEETIKRTPVGRIGTPEDIANAVSFLASKTSGFITGSTIHVNGGVYMN